MQCFRKMIFFVALINVLFFTHAQSVDGVFGSNEYLRVQTVSGMKIGFSISSQKDIIYCAIEAKTTGWVSIGLGKLLMDGSYIIMGCIQDGQSVFSEQLGNNYSHKPVTESQIINKMIIQNNEVTVMEFSIPAGAFLSNNSLDAIIAMSKNTSFSSKHTTKAIVKIKF